MKMAPPEVEALQPVKLLSDAVNVPPLATATPPPACERRARGKEVRIGLMKDIIRRIRSMTIRDKSRQPRHCVEILRRQVYLTLSQARTPPMELDPEIDTLCNFAAPFT